MRRRRFLASLPLLGGIAGCTQSPATPDSESRTTTAERDTDTDTQAAPVRISKLRVADFIEYPLSGTHPHVHRRSNTQYVVVRVDSSVDEDAVQRGLALELDDDRVSLADRQPVDWERDVVDRAFAVSKDLTVGGGRVLFDGTVVRPLSDATVERLNNPPVFEVSGPSVSPAELETTEVTDVTVRFTLANTGSGAGTFGASLTTNYVFGSQTVTASLTAGEERSVTASDSVRPAEGGATVRLDWGIDEWSTMIPVTDEATETPTPVGAPE